MPGVTFNVLQQITIELHYGPYEAHGVIQHKQQRLYGIKNRLEELDFEVKLIPTRMFNTLIVKMKDRQVFRCDIRNLLFNIDCEDDPVGRRLEMAVEDAKNRMLSDFSTVPKILSGSVLQLIRMDVASTVSSDASDLEFGGKKLNVASESMKNLAAANVKLGSIEGYPADNDGKDDDYGRGANDDDRAEEIVMKRPSSLKNVTVTTSGELALGSDTGDRKLSRSSVLKRATIEFTSDDKLTLDRNVSEETQKSKLNSHSSLLKNISGTNVNMSSRDNVSNIMDVASTKSEGNLDMDREYVASAENQLLLNQRSSTDTRITSDSV